MSPYDDKLNEECGVVGIWNADNDDALPLAVLGLHALQHRGQEGVGIVSYDGTEFHTHKRTKLVAEAFAAEKQRQFDLPGAAAIGHVRYATAGSGGDANLQPFVQTTRHGKLALAHNGNLTNAAHLRGELLQNGASFQSDSDTEVLLHLISRADAESVEDAINTAVQQIEGAYSLVILGSDALYGVRDAAGLRPLTIGRLGDTWMLASESCAIEAVGAEIYDDVKAGEIVRIDADGLTRIPLATRTGLPSKICVFEYIYFMRPNTRFDDRHAASVRERIGAQLFHESNEPCDLVIPVPESGIHAAVGYANAGNLPFKWAILKSPYVGRTFIEPSQSIRNFGVRLKLSIDKHMVKGRRVTLVDDSIVRSTTMRKLVELVRQAGADEVHVRISSPPFRFPCFYGIDTPAREELIASSMSVDEICREIGADSLAYISIDGLKKAVNPGSKAPIDYCNACFTGEYPVPIKDQPMLDELEGSDAVIADG